MGWLIYRIIATTIGLITLALYWEPYHYFFGAHDMLRGTATLLLVLYMSLLASYLNLEAWT